MSKYIIKKTQNQGILNMENLGKQIGTTETSINSRIQDVDKESQVLKIL